VRVAKSMRVCSTSVCTVLGERTALVRVGGGWNKVRERVCAWGETISIVTRVSSEEEGEGEAEEGEENGRMGWF